MAAGSSAATLSADIGPLLPPDFGQDLRAACREDRLAKLAAKTYGIGPGRVIGDMKEIIKNAILDGEIPNEYDAAYALMERLAAERGLTRVRK